MRRAPTEVRRPAGETTALLARTAWRLAGASVAVALVATLWFVVRTAAVRVPYWGEAEVLFEATRLRDHLPLWIDPRVGALEYGPPPSRFYVTYPPLWTWVVSIVPASTALLFARVASTLAWFGALAAIALTARREVRAETTAVAAFVGGIWVLTNFATIGRPDAVAAALAAVALVRATRSASRAERLDVLTIALFVLVPWVKPTMVGLPAFALLASGKRAILIAAALALASAAVAHVATGGLLFLHVIRSNAQPFALAAWLQQVPARLPFFAPLFAWAALLGLRDRARAGTRVALAALVGSFAWTLVALAKTGSSSNYWMEPCIAAVVLVATAERTPGAARLGDDRRLLPALVALVATLWADVASVRGAIEHARSLRAEASLVSGLRRACGAGPGDVVGADEAGIELVANGRILVPTYQMVHLVRREMLPAAPFIEDLRAPRLRCYVEHTGQLRLAPLLQGALEARFAAGDPRDGYRLWLPR